MVVKDGFKTYLNELIKSTNNFAKSVSFVEVNETTDEVTYSKNPMDLSTCLMFGAHNDYMMWKKDITEKDNLRKGSKNYLKYYRRNNNLIRIDSYVNGKLSVCYCAFVRGPYTFLIPFLPKTKRLYIATGSFVSVLDNEEIIESYYVTSNSVNRFDYQKVDKDNTDFSYISYVPKGKYPVLEYFKGKIFLGEKPELEIYKYYNWLKKEQKES